MSNSLPIWVINIGDYDSDTYRPRFGETGPEFGEGRRPKSEILVNHLQYAYRLNRQGETSRMVLLTSRLGPVVRRKGPEFGEGRRPKSEILVNHLQYAYRLNRQVETSRMVLLKSRLGPIPVDYPCHLSRKRGGQGRGAALPRFAEPPALIER